MIVNKLLSVKRDNNVLLYNITFNDGELYEFLNQLEEKYTRIENDIIETTFKGFKPTNYGKYDSMSDICYVNEKGLYETRKEKESEDYFKSLGGNAKEWDFLTEEEKLMFMPIDGVQKGKLKLEIVYPSILVKLIKEAFIGDDSKCIIDATNLIKLTNHIFGIVNELTYDKTIDLSDQNKNWNDPSIAFFSVDDYNNYLLKSARNLNKSNIKITATEVNCIFEDIDDIIGEFEKVIFCEQIGMFPINLELSEELEILKRFAIRNQRFNWIDKKLERSPIDFDGGSVINSKKDLICSNYDLNGVKTEQRILDRINRKQKHIDRLVGINDKTSLQEEPATNIENTLELKKIKAA